MQELGAGPRIVTECAKHLAGDHRHAALVHAAGGHAFVAGVDHHRHTGRVQGFLDALGDLCGEFFLYLEAARVALHHAGQLADADHPVGRHVADMCTADDRRHVVLAMALELDVAQDHHLVVAGDFLEGTPQILGRVRFITGEPVAISLDHPLGRVEQTFALRIIASPAQQYAHGIFSLLLGDAGIRRLLAHGESLGVRQTRSVMVVPVEVMPGVDAGDGDVFTLTVARTSNGW